MNSPARLFNIILIIACLSGAACNTTDNKDEDKGKAAFLRFHLETNPDDTDHTMQASVYRAEPMILTAERNAVLDEGFLEKAEVVEADELGGSAIKLTFDEAGTRRLDALTIEHRGRRFIIQAAWTETRWLAAPLITKRIRNGEFVFTPDATREESERIVHGLKNVIKKLHERYTL